MNSLVFQKIREVVDSLSRSQKVALAAATAVAIFCMIMLLVWANKAEYALLYSNLDAADTSKIIEDLKANKMLYRLGAGGSSIFVSKEDVYELRIKYAGQNLISTGAVGYELFDRNNLGLTDFMQRVNLKRALEGELSNTITRIESIVQSRVHLVIPEQALFEEKQKKTTASVVLKLRPHTTLDQRQVMGISNLIAASVEGLEPENVIIVDTLGKVLTKNQKRDNIIGLSSSQYDLQKNVEDYLSQKAQSMLDQVLGMSNSIVRVSARLNFDRVSRTSEKVDPDNFAVLSEERNEETSTGTDTTHFKRENTITNYELNKVIEQYESSVGDIKQLSIAVFVNGVYKSDEEPNVPRPDEEIQKITQMVKNAVGFNQERNDQIEVQQLAFDRTMIERETKLMASLEDRQNLMGYIKFGLGIGGAALFLFVLRGLMKKFGIDDYIKQQRELLLQETMTTLGEATNEGGEERKQIRLKEGSRVQQEFNEKIKHEVTEFTQKEDERAATILRYWMLEEEG